MEKKFKIIDENNVERDAELVTILNVKEKDYAVYSINRDKDNVNIFVSLIEKDANEKEYLKDIDDPKEKENLKEMIKEMIDKAK